MRWEERNAVSGNGKSPPWRVGEATVKSAPALGAYDLPNWASSGVIVFSARAWISPPMRSPKVA